MPCLKDPANFLVDSGLLFEINRRILHPLGLALSVEVPDENEADSTAEKCSTSVLDYRADPEGLIFEDEDLAKGRQKILDYLITNKVRERLMARRAVLGYVTQTEQHEKEPPFSIGPPPAV